MAGFTVKTTQLEVKSNNFITLASEHFLLALKIASSCVCLAEIKGS
jgi:hypothetical protein